MADIQDYFLKNKDILELIFIIILSIIYIYFTVKWYM